MRSRLEIMLLVSRLPKNEELFEVIVDICPVYPAFVYAKKFHMYSKKLEDRISKSHKELIVPWALVHGGSDELRAAVCKAEDAIHPYRYASVVDGAYHKETHEAVKNTPLEADYRDLIGV